MSLVVGSLLHFPLLWVGSSPVNITGRAASIADLCISPKDFQEQLGEFSHYCPVSLATKGELVDCSGQTSLQLAAGYR